MLNSIPIVTVSYNTPDLVSNLVRSIRSFYPANPIYIVDGSDDDQLAVLREVLQDISDVQLHAHGFNIHHGPGMAWALQNLPLGERCLFLDSDVTLLKPGMLEDLLAHLRPGMYGVGDVRPVRPMPNGRDVLEGQDPTPSLPYLHPACMLCHPEVMLQWPLPFKHGAPMLTSMQAIHDADQSAALLGHVPWVKHDFGNPDDPVFISHPWQGTVLRSGSYNLDDPVQDIRKSGQYDATGIAFNADLLNIIPPETQRVIEVGCDSGGLAAALKRRNPACHVMGVEFREDVARRAVQHCDAVYPLDVEAMLPSYFQLFSDRQCWVFGDVLEHLIDPWKVLKNIRGILPPGGSVAVCLPNMQHWSVQARLAAGMIHYEEGGLLDRTHLRWFTRQTALQMFADCGFRMVAGYPRIFDEPQRTAVLPWIKEQAKAMGADPEQAEIDALAMQYVMLFEAS
ncbi:bifunctional glycosyltransferase/class I SAM-dependent methyltransferase [Paraburkholderia fungorum]|uniref:methyltransferase domain-containing protein n=1 Tax=Paraburkholderia fungorum TaxID=134537 RepID=UPI0038B97223